MRGLIAEGMFLQPTKLWIQYRYNSGSAGGATVTLYGIGRDTTDPVKLIDPVVTLDDTTTPGMETSSLISVDVTHECTHVVAVVDNVEELKVRDIGFLYIPTKVVANEYNLP